jgi:hypothetical protein
MSRFRRSIVVAAGAIVVAIVPIGLSYGRASMAAAQTVRLPEIESPRTWIPFSAIVTKTDPTGEVVVVISTEAMMPPSDLKVARRCRTSRLFQSRT